MCQGGDSQRISGLILQIRVPPPTINKSIIRGILQAIYTLAISIMQLLMSRESTQLPIIMEVGKENGKGNGKWDCMGFLP